MNKMRNKKKNKSENKNSNKNSYIIIISFVWILILTNLVMPVLVSSVFQNQSENTQRLLSSTFSQIFIIGGFSFLLLKKFPGYTELKIINLETGKRTYIRNLLATVLFFYASKFVFDSLGLVYISLTENFNIIHKIAPLDMPSFLIYVFLLGVLPAIFEELYYRHVIYIYYSEMKKSFGFFLSAFLFAIAHSGFQRIIITFVFAMLLMKAFEETEALILPVTMHLIFNVLTLYHDHIILLPSENILVQYKYTSPIGCLIEALQFLAFGLCLSAITYAALFSQDLMAYVRLLKRSIIDRHGRVYADRIK